MSYLAAVLADSPLAIWRLNEPSGSVAADSSGNARNAAYVGTVTYGLAGPTFDAGATAVSSSGSANYIEFGSYGSTAPFVALQPKTVEMWLRTESNGTGTVYSKSDTIMEITSSSGFGSRNLRMAFNFGTTDAVAITGDLRAKLSNAKVWVHAVATLDSSNVPRIYIDGVEGGGVAYQQQTTGAGTRTDGDNNNTPRVFRDRFSVGPPSGLRVSDVAIYATLLSTARIVAHRTAGITPPSSSGLLMRRRRAA